MAGRAKAKRRIGHKQVVEFISRIFEVEASAGAWLWQDERRRSGASDTSRSWSSSAGSSKRNVHAKRVASLANGVDGVLHAASLGIRAIGQGLAEAQGLTPRHAIKQVDRLLSNSKLGMESLFSCWVSFVLAEREEIVVNFDWTEFEDSDQSMVVLGMQTGHGRSTPLVLEDGHALRAWGAEERSRGRTSLPLLQRASRGSARHASWPTGDSETASCTASSRRSWASSTSSASAG